MHAAPQGVELRLIALAAVNRQHVKALEMRGVALKGLGHLQGELAGRHQHQHLRLAAGQIEALERRQGERGRLARAGLRLAEQVGAGQQRRDGGGLDGRGRFVADLGERPQERFAEAQITESRRTGCFVRVRMRSWECLV